LKTRLENHPSAEQITAQVAARTFDRAYLYDLIRRLDAEVDLEDDTLELIELDDTKEAIQLEPSKEAEQAAAELTFQAPPSDASLPREEVSSTTDAQISPSTEEEEMPLSEELSEEVALNVEVPENLVATSTTSSPYTRSQTALAPQSRLLRLKKRQLSRIQSRLEGKDESAELKLRRIARRSVSRHRGVASETLANLLVGQGQYQRAIRMYEELSLAHPEKKATFAAQIKELKEKL
ncbi:MAG: hypothetical protein AAFY91_06780, partial [Bacteroidota bacterium]